MNANRALVALTAALALHTTTALAVVITTNTALSPGDLLYDGQPIVVSNCTLTVNGVHSFASLLLTDSAVLTHSPAPAGETNNRLDLAVAGEMTIDATSRVDVNAKGYGSTAGPGAGTTAYNASGGGYGGPGGNSYGGPAGGVSYGDLLAPAQCGSGGGNIGAPPGGGGAGGGVIRLDVSGALTVDGQLTANGESGKASCGAGGSIHVIAGTLAGNGSITANGGSTSNLTYIGSGGGGGGRIALYYSNSTFSGELTALGGLASGVFSGNSGGAGTLYTKANSQSVGDLLLNNSSRHTNAMETPITSPVAYRLTLSNVTAYATVPITLTGLRVSANGLLTHPFQGPRLRVLVQGNAVVEGGGAIGADARGYPLQTGPGAGSGGAYGGSGAGHGGPGGACYYGQPGGVTYDSVTEPVDFGSGGGGSAAPNRGGGAIQLTVAGTFTIDGRVSANADAVTGGYDGGGSGGSIWLTASRLNGTGSITANGQLCGYSLAGSGGGGRIAIYTGVNLLASAVTANGGLSTSRPGGNGTVHYGPNVPTGLISWWRGEGDASDTMGVHPGTPQGGLGYAAGQVGQAFVLNGQDAAVALGSWFDLQEFTLSLWVKPGTTQVQWADILDNNHTDYRGWAIQSANNSVSAASQWSWGANNAGGVYYWMTNSAWQQIVVTVSSNHISHLYRDGQLIQTVTGGAIVYDGTQFFSLGKHHLLGRYFNGMVDELMCFNRALSPEEVASLYFTQGGPLQLNIQLTSSGVLLSWPASAASFGLVSRTNLTAGNWESVTNAPSLNGDRKEVLLPATTPAQRFFRLAQ